MSLHLKISSIIVSALIFIVIIALVRRRRLREEFSLIWLLAGALIFIVAIWERPVNFIGEITGIIAPTSILFSFGIIFLILVNLQLSIKLSENSDQIKNLIQRLALYENCLKDKKGE